MMNSIRFRFGRRASSRRAFLTGFVVLTGIGVVGAWAATGSRLIINGQVASTSVVQLNGAAYVRVADVARSLNLVVVKRAGGYELKKPGGTYQVGQLSGKLGDVLFDGKWRFQVLSRQSPASFTFKTPADTYDNSNSSKWNSATRTLEAAPGYKLVVLQCRVTNAVKEKRTLWTAISDKRINTALTDFAGGSHSPIAYDFAGGPTQSQWLLPGAILNFPVVFSVPQNTQVKDLVFSLKNNQTDAPPIDVRVSLAE